MPIRAPKQVPGYLALCLFSLSGMPAAAEVVVYTSVDEILSSRVFEVIEQRVGLDIRPVYDSEATKTTGLYLRILQERENPRADVFWNSEFSRTLLLKEEGILKPHRSEQVETFPLQFRDPGGYWTGFSTRARVVAYNTRLVSATEVPRSADELEDVKWKGRIAWATPLFGTTATHCGSLLATLGEEAFRSKIRIWSEHFRQVASNGQAAELVAKGALPLALTDTDDVWRLLLRGEPIGMVPYDESGMGTLLIPNTVAILDEAPHPEEAERFVDALLTPEVEEFLAASTSRQIPVRENIPVPVDLEPWMRIPVMQIDYETVSRNVDSAMRILRGE